MRIFAESEEEQKGHRWVEREESDPAYVPGENVKGVLWKRRKMIHEPEHGAELSCFWNAPKEIWEPCQAWPPVLHRKDPGLDEG